MDDDTLPDKHEYILQGGRLDIIPSNINLSLSEINLRDEMGGERTLTVPILLQSLAHRLLHFLLACLMSNRLYLSQRQLLAPTTHILQRRMLNIENFTLKCYT